VTGFQTWALPILWGTRGPTLWIARLFHRSRASPGGLGAPANLVRHGASDLHVPALRRVGRRPVLRPVRRVPGGPAGPGGGRGPGRRGRCVRAEDERHAQRRGAEGV